METLLRLYMQEKYSHLMVFFSFCIDSFLSTKMSVWSRSLIVLLLCVIVVTNANDAKLYNNHQLWRMYPTNNEQITKILAFSRISHLHNIDFWSENFHINQQVSFYSNLFSFITSDVRSMFVYHLKQQKCSLISCQEMM